MHSPKEALRGERARPDHADQELRPATWTLCLGLTVLVSLLLMSRVDGPIVGFDDANIFFVYARNVAHGHGFVFNPGGERVEGFTSLLWTLLLVPFFYFSLAPERMIVWLNMVLVSLAVGGLLRATARCLGRSSNPRRGLLGAAILGGWIFLSPPYFFWTVLSLMDTGLWAVLNIFFYLACLRPMARGEWLARDAAGVAVCASLLVATRPESLATVPLILVVLTVWGLRATGEAAQRRGLLIPWLAFALTSLAILSFRKLYFGYLAPNTYYAKVSAERLDNAVAGLIYDWHIFHWSVPCAVGAVAALGGAAWFVKDWVAGRGRAAPGGGRLSAPAGLNAAFVLTALGLPLVGGGDHFGSFRFIQPYWPFFMLTPLMMWPRLSSTRFGLSAPRLGKPALMLALTMLIIDAFSTRDNWTSQLHSEPKLLWEFVLAQKGRTVGEWLNQLVDRHPEFQGNLKVGVITAGGIAVTYRGPVCDLLGLNNVAMAHASGDRNGLKNHAAFNAGVFFVQRPALVIPFPPQQALVSDRSASIEDLCWGPAPSRPDGTSDRAAVSQTYLRGTEYTRAFRTAYRPAVVPLNDEGTMGLFAYYRRDILSRLAAADPGVRVEPDEAWLAGTVD
jgi:hypothetical protein